MKVYRRLNKAADGNGKIRVMKNISRDVEVLS